MQLNPYLAFDGTCAEAFRFYEQALGGEILMMMTNGQSPMAEHTPPESRHRILHAQLRIGDDTLMGSDAPAGQHVAMSGFFVCLMPKTPEDAERVFATLAEGGEVRMPLQQTFWSPSFGMLADRFGTPWMISCMSGA